MQFDQAKNSRLTLSHLKTIPYWHRPGGGIKEIIERMRETGIKDPTKLGTSYMELYVASLLGLGLQESDKLDFWIAKPQDDPPDMAFMTVSADEKNRYLFNSREVEITRCLNNGKSILDSILDKDNPSYPEDYIIVCFLEFEGAENLKELSDRLLEKLKFMRHVFLVFHGMPFDNMNQPPTKEEMIRKVSIVQLTPVFLQAQVIDIVECLNKWKKDDNKLITTENGKVYYNSLKEKDRIYPKIIRV